MSYYVVFLWIIESTEILSCFFYNEYLTREQNLCNRLNYVIRYIADQSEEMKYKVKYNISGTWACSIITAWMSYCFIYWV